MVLLLDCLPRIGPQVPDLRQGPARHLGQSFGAARSGPGAEFRRARSEQRFGSRGGGGHAESALRLFAGPQCPTSADSSLCRPGQRPFLPGGHQAAASRVRRVLRPQDRAARERPQDLGDLGRPGDGPAPGPREEDAERGHGGAGPGDLAVHLCAGVPPNGREGADGEPRAGQRALPDQRGGGAGLQRELCERGGDRRGRGVPGRHDRDGNRLALPGLRPLRPLPQRRAQDQQQHGQVRAEPVPRLAHGNPNARVRRQVDGGEPPHQGHLALQLPEPRLEGRGGRDPGGLGPGGGGSGAHADAQAAVRPEPGRREL
mmetsp:Transcript_34479/g.77955  ORF Transcript_34479/g.77955 Transcript_34479/m.77955 type:complete len:316 (+) Transcript_34479:1935-2882(+)